MSAPRARPEFTLVVTMGSDWHVGAGVGRPGAVNRLVARDQDGLPYLPAKTLTGIWRDACEQVAASLDQGGSGWTALVEAVFGSQPGAAGSEGERRLQGPRPAALSVRPARLSPELRAALTAPDRSPLREALTFVRPGVRIDPASGRALDRHLRFTEMARGGCRLRAPGCRLDLDRLPGEELALAAWALLVAGLRLVDHLGGSRRRGAGRCRWSIEGLGPEEELALIKHLEARPRAPEPALPGSRPRAGLRRPSCEGEGWVELQLRLELLDPVLAQSRVLGNVVEGLDHLPGRLLLPLVEAAVIAAGFDPREAIARGDLRVLPAYPELEGARGRPVPFVLRQRKGAGPRGSFHGAGAVEPGLKPVRSGYVGPWREGDEEIAYRRAASAVHVHNTIADAQQRPAGPGGIYGYQAIEAGSRLAAAVRLRSGLAQDLGDWWRHLAGERRLGGSRKDDFGRVRVEVAPPRRLELGLRPRDGRLRVWCLSDVLLEEGGLRDPRLGGTSAERLGEELGRQLGVRLSVDEGPLGLRVRRHDAWQERWGLPRPSLVTIAAGSVVSFWVEGTLHPEAAARCLAAGVGLRRAEGFGDLALNDPLLFAPTVSYRPPRDPRQDAPASPGPLDEADREFAEVVERAAWRSQIQAAAIDRGAEDEFRSRRLGWGPGLTSSQLGTLRAMVRSRDRVERLEALAAVERRARRWGIDAIGELRRLFTNPEEVWRLLEAGGWPTLTPDGAARLRQELWEEALVLLIDEAARRQGGER
ncbi:MAG TPA: RAMP superfamily CRISPR-associated protein [Candidatus Dormibacteraeota bacterium]|nr:RAMP superfamily CRISPR-associated protein [Candidatus Dormibacteraeota bacterium]